jgi:uncharacterized protein YyaL (SSP411 family)
MRTAAAGLPQMLVAYLLYRGGPRQIVIAAADRGADPDPMIEAVHRRFLPGWSLIAVRSNEDRHRLAPLADKKPVNGATAAYVCENFTCQLPVTNVDELVQLLQ